MTLGTYLFSCLVVFAVCILPAYGLVIWRLSPTVNNWRRRRAAQAERIIT